MTALDADRQTLLDLIKDEAVFHGDFTLSSGKKATYYVDLRKVSLDHRVAPLIGQVMLDLIADIPDVAAVGGMTMGADPVACAALAGGADVKAFFVRKEVKAHGLARRVEGPLLDGDDRCLVVEDVVSTGGSTIKAIEALQEEGLKVCGVVSVLDRLMGGGERVAAAAGAPYLALTTIDDVYPERPDREAWIHR